MGRLNVLVMNEQWNERWAAFIEETTAVFTCADDYGEAPEIVVDKTAASLRDG